MDLNFILKSIKKVPWGRPLLKSAKRIRSSRSFLIFVLIPLLIRFPGLFEKSWNAFPCFRPFFGFNMRHSETLRNIVKHSVGCLKIL